MPELNELIPKLEFLRGVLLPLLEILVEMDERLKSKEEFSDLRDAPGRCSYAAQLIAEALGVELPSDKKLNKPDEAQSIEEMLRITRTGRKSYTLRDFFQWINTTEEGKRVMQDDFRNKERLVSALSAKLRETLRLSWDELIEPQVTNRIISPKYFKGLWGSLTEAMLLSSPAESVRLTLERQLKADKVKEVFHSWCQGAALHSA